nr:NADH dehydrogenase subunit 5 [Hydroides norvegica]
MLWAILLGCFFCYFVDGPVLYLQQFGDFFGGFLCFGFLVDSTSLSFGGVVGLVSVAVYFYSMGYMGGDLVSRKFFSLVFIFISSMFLLIFSADFMSMFLAWEGLGVSSFLLVVYYNNHASAASGIITMMSNRVGDVCFLLGLGSTFAGGDFSFLFSEGWGCGFFFLACVAKSAQWPLCGWLPAAMAAPTPVSALVHSSTLVTAGGYLLFRFESVELAILESVLIVPVVTMLLASLSALVSYDLKRMVAMSTLSHIALICWAILGGYESLAFFHLLSHALFKSLLFLCAGVLIQSVGHSQDIRLMGGSFEGHFICSVGLLYSSTSMMGMPLFGGYDSKELVMSGIMLSGLQGEELLFLLGVFTLVFSGGYALRLMAMLLEGGRVSVSGGNSSKAMLGSIITLFILGSILAKWGYYYSSVGVMVPGFLNWGWLGLFAAGVVVGEWVTKSELDSQWYEVGELGAVSSVISSELLASSLLVGDSLEMGWLEKVGGEGLLSVSSGVRGSVTNNEW